MSWFEYGKPSAKTRRNRKGVWLRANSFPQEIVKLARKKMRFGEVIDYVIVKEMRPNNMVLLQFWCCSPLKGIIAPSRHTVFTLLVEENCNWICEGDVGKGWREI